MTLRHAQDDPEPGRVVRPKLGTRGSQLALFQANAVSMLLHAKADVECEIVVIKTSGDRLAEATIAQIGGKRLFVKEIEDALLAGEIDLAVHSSKDMPVVLPGGLAIGAALPREDARDAVVLPADSASNPASAYADSTDASAKSASDTGLTLDELAARLGSAPRIGTSSVRRTAQLTRLFPGARFLPVRGNLDTRLRKLDTGEYDALVLASAGLVRLGHRARISAALPISTCVPAPGQGIIAIEARAADRRMMSWVAAIDDLTSRAALDAERTVVTRLGGGCQMPIGVYADVSGGALTLVAIVLSLDGAQVLRAESRGPISDANAVGSAVAEDLLAQGAVGILADIERAHAAVEGLQP
jgi:hydroxymethylbilane synthase